MSKKAAEPGDVFKQFELPEWDAPWVRQADEELNASVDLMSKAKEDALELGFKQRSAAEAVDACLEASLTAVDMVWVARDSQAFTSISIQNGSWEVDEEPQPCSIDSYLRGAMPEAAVQVLAGPRPGTQASGTGANTRRPPSNASQSTKDPTTTSYKVMVPAAPKTPPADRPSLSQLLNPPVPASVEEKLREELKVRRQQQMLAKNVNKKDEERKAKLQEAQKRFGNREYGYDHRGEIIQLNPFASDSSHLTAGPTYNIASVDEEGEKGGRKQVSIAAPAPSRASGSDAKAAAAGAAADADPGKTKRKFGQSAAAVTDFIEMEKQTQPSPIETMKISEGVTVRADAQARSGPHKQPAKNAVTREEHQKKINELRSTGMLGATAKATLMKAALNATSSTNASPDKTGGGGGGGGVAAGSGSGPGSDQAAPAPPAGDRLMAGPVEGLTGGDAGSIIDVLMRGAKPRDSTPPEPEPGDVHYGITKQSDWGVPVPGSYSAPKGLSPTKPPAGEIQKELGRTTYLPRARVAPPTLSNKSRAGVVLPLLPGATSPGATMAAGADGTRMPSQGGAGSPGQTGSPVVKLPAVKAS